ncbi:LamG-like jellyroll fold domain-containing protein [Chloroflexota bacterium]
MKNLKRFPLFILACSLLLVVSPTTVASAHTIGPQLNVVPASPLTGVTECRSPYEPPQCTAIQLDTSQDFAFQGNGFAQAAVAKDVIPGHDPIHRPEFANDGFYGNGASWISNSWNSWVKVDLGRIVLVDRVTLGRDRNSSGHDDRDPGQFTIEVALTDDIYANGNDNNDVSEYSEAFDSSDVGFSGIIIDNQTLEASFSKVEARFIKLTVTNIGTAIDEVEVFGNVAPTVVPGLIHLWSGEGNANDSVGSAHGTLGVTTAFGTGLTGQAFSFDGLQSSIVNPLPVNINPSVLPQMTMGMLVNLRSAPNGYGWVIGHDNGGYDRSLNLHDNRYGFGVAGGTGVAPHLSSLIKLKDNLNTWHWVAVSYDQAALTATFYADGSTQTVYANHVSGEDDATLGGLENFLGHTVDGLVDEVFMFNRVLSTEEIDQVCADLSNQPPKVNAGPDATIDEGETFVSPPSGLVSWWRGEGNAIDSIDGNNGVLQNGVTFATGQ